MKNEAEPDEAAFEEYMVDMEGSMNMQEKGEQQVVPVAREQRITIDRVKKFAAQHQEALEELAKHDGRVRA